LENHIIYLATTHFGWSDGYEIFENQVDAAYDVINQKDLSIVAGDFNITPDSKEYQYIVRKGLIDIFKEDPEFSNKPTHVANMDIHPEGKRIDYIMTNKPVTLLERDIVFSKEVVSDHFGVYANIQFE